MNSADARGGKITTNRHAHTRGTTTVTIIKLFEALKYGGWSAPKVPFPCGRPNLLLTVHFSWSYSYLNVTFKFERKSQIWRSHVHLNLNLTFEGHSHLNVNLTFEGHSHIWRQPHIWTSISHLNVTLKFERHSYIWTSNSCVYAYVRACALQSTCLQAVFGLGYVLLGLWLWLQWWNIQG